MRVIESESDQQFFLRLYQQYKRLVLARALAYGDAGNAEDVAQEAWIRLLGKLPKLRELPEGAQVNYIVFTVRSAAFDLRRKRELDRRTETEYGARSAEETVPGAEEEFLSHLSEFHIADIWEKLTAEEQLLLEGKYLMDLDDAALAALLGCRPASVRMLLTRTRRKAKRLLMERRRSGSEP